MALAHVAVTVIPLLRQADAEVENTVNITDAVIGICGYGKNDANHETYIPYYIHIGNAGPVVICLIWDVNIIHDNTCPPKFE
jgi:hypothetical protein